MAEVERRSEETLFPDFNDIEIVNVGTDPTDMMRATLKGTPVMLSRCLVRPQNMDVFASQVQELTYVALPSLPVPL